MKLAPRLLVLALVVTAYVGTLNAAQETTAAQRPTLAPEQMEAFLLKARITRIRDAGNGVTASRRATLTDGTLTHDAHIQNVAIEKSVFEAANAVELNFKDLYRYNIAGYRLAVLLGLDNVPMSVERQIDGKAAAVTWWVDDVLMDEKQRIKEKTTGPNPGRTAQQIQIMRVFDELIQNKDRNQGNILWTKDWKMWLIDHTRAFRWGTTLLKPENMVRCDRSLLEHMRALTAESLAKAMGEAMTKPEIAGLLARRDLIVKHFDDKIAKTSEAAVLFTLNQ